ncbi:MAG TPA: UDP-N-acetylmuramoyl-L-alanyl-D-glutamate--2,6-diaminopimelate ligase [Acidimicrobiales bacterium]|jgi:UDP-N-acetylmuramoyl-L-alanyl-D-glutamate--2,6-diaminopimelate ligase
MRLDRLVDAVAGATPVLAGRMAVAGDAAAADVVAVTHDSRAARAGTLFCCIPGERADGHDFAGDALAAGAVALLCERALPFAVPQVLVADARAATGPFAAEVAGHPSRRLRVVGVTGTNGKTTTTHLLRSVLEAAGWPTGVIGTLSGVRTTPEAPELQARLGAMADGGAVAVAMEVSSHALALRRVDGTRFAVAVFTNLSRDHLDFHPTMEHYFQAKARLFEPDLAERAVVNLDDPHGRLLRDAATIPTAAYTMADAGDLAVGPTSSTFTWRGRPVRLPLGGRFNVSNALAAATAAEVLGLDPPTIAAGLATAGPVPGRFEPVDRGQPFTVLVDYAHTPDGLDQVLAAARELARPPARVLVVFGCGGDRDRTKRPAMGAAAVEGADLAVLTSDNPRHEDPLAIIDEVRKGVPAGAPLVVEPDRRAAIAVAVGEARPGDVVVVAGKGHETYQDLGDRVVPFDDRVVAGEALEAAGPW